MESSIAEFLSRQPACELLPTREVDASDVFINGDCLVSKGTTSLCPFRKGDKEQRLIRWERYTKRRTRSVVFIQGVDLPVEGTTWLSRRRKGTSDEDCPAASAAQVCTNACDARLQSLIQKLFLRSVDCICIGLY